MLKKIAMLGITFVLSTPIFGAVVPGQMSYFLHGKVVSRDVSLDVPSRGEGDILLLTKDLEQSLIAVKRYTQKSEGLTQFVLVFDQYPGKKDKNDFFIMWGNYERSAGKVVYLGHSYIMNSEVIPDLQSIEHAISAYPSARMIGNFSFSLDF
jgi:hypothetical protein